MASSALPVISCPECGHHYPPGTIVLGGEILDPIAESGGPIHRCSGVSHGESLGLFQQVPGSFHA